MESGTNPKAPGHPPAVWMRPDLWLEEKARVLADKTAILFNESRISFEALWNRVLRLAEGLAHEGLKKGDRVVCISTNHPAFLETYFASSLLGTLFVPLNFRLTLSELTFQVNHAEPSAILLGPLQWNLADGLCHTAAARKPKLFCVQKNRGKNCCPYESLFSGTDKPGPAEEIRSPVSPEDPQLIMYTSGTTGIPKGPLLPYRKTLYNSLNAKVFFELSPEDAVVVPVPLFHSLGLNILSIPVLFQGGTVILMDRFDPADVLNAIQDHRATFMGAVPTIYKRLLEYGVESFDLSSLRFGFTAGAPIPVSLIEAYHRRGILLKQGFGQTETSILCCLDARDAIRKAGSVGKPVEHAEVRVVNEKMEDVLPGVLGEIVARGPIVMLGYWNRPEETANAFKGPWLRTQDLAMRDEEGFITLAGRKSDMYISGGENINPEEIEKTYLAYPGIEEIAVIGVPDPDLGEVGLACLVLREGFTPDEPALREYARDKLAGFKIPRRFLQVEHLPHTETGKIQKYVLRKQLGINETGG